MERLVPDPSLADAQLPARRLRFTWILWGVFCLAAAIFFVLDTRRNGVNEAYAKGARHWQQREPLYTGDGLGFIYLPHAAILHSAFLMLPHRAAYEVAWRIATIGLFAAGVYRLARCCDDSADRDEDSSEGRTSGQPPPRANLSLPLFFLTMTLVILPKSWTVAVNGQATPALAGLMMLAVADIAERRHWRATIALFAALAFKPLAIVLILLAGALYRPLAWRLSVGALVFLGLPFLAADPAYAAAQTLAFLHNLNDAAAVGQTQQQVWPQIFSLFDVVGFGIPIPDQFLVQSFAALATLALAWLACHRFPRFQAGVLLYALAAGYLLLFNPRTENSSYTLIIPAVAALFARSLLVEKDLFRSIYLGAIAAGLTGGFEICRVLTPEARFVWPCPVACLAFQGFLAVEIAKARCWGRFPLTENGSRDIQPTEIPCSA
jgi:hypothetical protein